MFRVMTAVFLNVFGYLLYSSQRALKLPLHLLFLFDFFPFSQLDLVPGVKSSLAPALPPTNPHGRLGGALNPATEGKRPGMLLTWENRSAGGTFSPNRVNKLASPFSEDWERGWFLIRVPVTALSQGIRLPSSSLPLPLGNLQEIILGSDHLTFPHLLLPEAQSTLDLRIQSSSQR